MSSPLWRKMTADVFGAKVVTTQTSDGPALGAAMLAAVGAGAFASVPEVCSAVIQHTEAIEPDEASGLMYESFHSIYKGLYKATCSSFSLLQALG